jgi:eukaryotic-like serine/threonine-protein kinase
MYRALYRWLGSDDANLYALNAATGAALGTFTIGGGIESTPVVADGVVYVGSFDHNVYAFGLAGGNAAVKRPAWQSFTPTTLFGPSAAS